MREALALARRGAGTASPNPMVGAVVVDGGRIVGRGYHLRPGTAHAEVAALDDAGPLARGATLYTTLEPCDHHGRTPPCTEAIIRAGLRRVVAAMADPDVQVRGRGLRRLRDAGIEVRTGVAEDDARRLNEAYVKHRTTGLPFVTAKWAMTLDGRIATRSGESRWISGERSRALAHEHRAASDAILVGIGTVLLDDPALTARPAAHAGDSAPIAPPGDAAAHTSHVLRRVLLDSRLRVPLGARVLARDGTPVFVATTPAADPAAGRALEARGAEVLVCGAPDGRVDLAALLRELGRRDVLSLFVEGGGTVHGAFMDAGLVDKVLAFIAPRIVGGPAPGPVGGAGVASLAEAWRLDRTTIHRVGDDVVIEGYPARGTDGARPAPAEETIGVHRHR